MSLPLFDLLEIPFEEYSTRMLTDIELSEGKYTQVDVFHGVKDKLIARVSTHTEAVKHVVDNLLSEFRAFSDKTIKDSAILKKWQNSMPSVTPSELIAYQKTYPKFDSELLFEQICESGVKLKENQIIFHGGLLSDGAESKILSRPLSTTLCPLVALNETFHKGKAYEQEEIHIYILKVVNPKTKVYVFKHEDIDLGHEKEVLFSKGAEIKFGSKECINEKFKVANASNKHKLIPVYIIEAEIS